MNDLHRIAANQAGWHIQRARGLLLRGLLGGSLILGSGLALAQNAPPTPGLKSAPEAAVENSDLTAPLFYQLLLSELSVQGGDPGAGYSYMLDAARKQHDAQLYRRAVEIALQARSADAALSAAKAWSEDLKDSPDANRFVLQILLALNKPGETGPVLSAVLAQAKPEELDGFIHSIPQIYARVSDKALALRVVRETLAPLTRQAPHAAAALTAVGRMELAQDQLPQALASARLAQAAEPTSVYPAMLALELMELGQDGAEDVVRAQLQASPPKAGPGSAVALTYARILLDLQRNSDARKELEQLTQAQPEMPEPWLLLSSLQVQDNNTLTEASASLQKYMTLARQSGDERSQRGLTQAYLLMAQIAEKQKDYAAANAWLDRIENADDIMAAQMRRASLLARQGHMDQARALLRNQPERRPDDARLKLVAEAQLLRDFKDWQQAYEVYGEASARFPEDSDLIYDQAMMAEKADHLDVMETLLRQLIATRPDHHHAYNALGYSLADRKVRLPEAKKLIEKAVELAPNDAYIQDSLGWVEFRMGHAQRALDILQEAYAKRPDPEIAAHLGEVLWSQGQREQALKIWREGLLLSGDNETLVGTLRRLNVQP